MKINKLFMKASEKMEVNSNLKKITAAVIALIFVICAFTPMVSSQVDKSSSVLNAFEEPARFDNYFLKILYWVITNLMESIGNKPLINRLYEIFFARLSTKYYEKTDTNFNSNKNYDDNLLTQKMTTTLNLQQLLAGDWNATLNFNEPGGGYDNVIFGEKTNASDGQDSYDIPKSPPGIPPYIRAWFATSFPDPYDELWSEHKQYPDTYKEWNLTIQWVPSDYSSPTTANISWNSGDVNNSGYNSVVLYDVANSVNVADMLQDDYYSFTCPALALQKFTIICNTITNQPPIANNDSVTVNEDSTNNQIDVLTNDTDPDGDSLSVTSVTAPSYGTATYTASYVYYTPDANYTGPDQFGYSISDGNGGSDSATVFVTVAGVNDPPVANDDSATVNEDSVNNSIDVLLNDNDPDGDNLTITSVTIPAHGSASTDGNYTYYTPDSNYNGGDQFGYTVSDGNGGSDTATVYVTVNPVNDPPVANDDYVTIIEESTNNSIDALANDYDIDFDDLDIIGVSTPAHGNATYTADYIFYTPDPDYSGSDQFTYTISDNNGGSDTATIYVTITTVNDPPVANDDSATVNEDSTNNQIDVLANDTDPDGDSLTITSATQPQHGSTTYTASYVYYTPDVNYTGPDQFSYSITDNNGEYDSAIVNITVNGTNDPPTANNDLANVDEDSKNNRIDVLANDNDPDGDDLEVAAVTQPIHGTVLFTSDYVYYTPDPNYNGLDEFNYTISDGNGGYDNATVFVIVDNINDPPVAYNDTATVDEDSTENQLDVMTNDVDIDGDTLSIVSITIPTHGNATINGTYISYTPDANYNGADQIEYNITDGNGAYDTATVSITVTSVNDPPIANDDNATVDEDSTDNVILVLSNDLDIDGDTLTVINVTTPIHGSATYTNNFVYYSPDPDYNGPDQFNYTITDTNDETDNATVYINVTGGNDPPNANTDSFTVIEDSTNNELDVLANDTDPDGDSLTISSVTQPSNGVTTFTSAYVYYTPDPDFVGQDAFSYSISDGNGGTDSAAVLITVVEANDPPYVPSDPNPQNGSTAVPFDVNISWNCSDPDSNPVTYDVYFGTNSSPPIVASNISNTTYNPGMLDDETTYYWKIIAKDNHSAQTEGPLWDFTTAQNHPPFPPRNPNPENGAIMVDPEMTLSWSGGDPDPGDFVTYDVYLSENPQPWQVVNNQSENTYNPPGKLNNYTKYYWKIVSWDIHGTSLSGPVWEFTTGNFSNKPPTIPTILGPIVAGSKVAINFSALSTDREENQIWYMWDWGDGNFSEWIGPFESGEIASTNYTWKKDRNYTIKVKARDNQKEESDWSILHNVSVARQITITEPKLGFIVFDIFLFNLNRSYFYINLLQQLDIAVLVTILGRIPVAANATDAVHKVKFEAYGPIMDITSGATDDNSSDGFSTDIKLNNSFFIILLTANAYDQDNYLIDSNTINLVYVYLKRGGGGP